MTPYQVEWTSTAEDQLADSWLHAPNPQAVTAAQAAIDHTLAQNPLGHGAEVGEGLRKIVVPPLTAYYQVFSTPPAVEVSAVTFTP